MMKHSRPISLTVTYYTMLVSVMVSSFHNCADGLMLIAEDNFGRWLTLYAGIQNTDIGLAPLIKARPGRILRLPGRVSLGQAGF